MDNISAQNLRSKYELFFHTVGKKAFYQNCVAAWGPGVMGESM